MSQSKFLLNRAASDLKSDTPIIINYNGAKKVIIPYDAIKEYKFKKGHLVVSAELVNFYLSDNVTSACSADIVNIEETLLQAPFYELFRTFQFHEKAEFEDALILLLKFLELMPICVIVELNDIIDPIPYWTNIDKYQEILHFVKDPSLTLVSKTIVKIKSIGEVEVVGFRQLWDSHYALTIKKGDSDSEAPMVRLHSSCYLGDILDSLECDCHDQLHFAFQAIAKSGGTILYISQDGRGIGALNKLRAYNLQKDYDMDTLDANTALGFKSDERNFAIAAKMMKPLNLDSVRLLTNNLQKVKNLQSYGIRVERVNVDIVYNEHNMDYIKTKVRKFGHVIDI